MDFIDSLKDFSKKINEIKSSIQTEEATKMSLIIPFFHMLGYDVFNPKEFCPEYTADVGIKKHEKIDYAILSNNKPLILVECKWCGEDLTRHGSQLFRYFGTSSAKFGILTNGIIYKFYTDLDEKNKMDLVPFLEINLLDLKDNLITEVKKFSKDSFDTDSILVSASDLKYTHMIKELLKKEKENPSDDFVKFFLKYIYNSPKTQKAIDKFKPIVKKSFNSFINDIVNLKIASALSEEESEEDTLPKDIKSKIITTQEEMESFYIVRSILAEYDDINNISYRDVESYFGILYKNNNRNPICRLKLSKSKKQLFISKADKSMERIDLESVYDIYKYKDNLIRVLQYYKNMKK